jgi:hypothetical protein
MITKDAIKAEIDDIQEKEVETVYKSIRVFTLSTERFNESAGRTEDEGA